MATKVAASTSFQELQRKEKRRVTSSRVSSGTGRPVTAKASSAVAASRLKKTKDDNEAEKKKHLEDKKSEALAEKKKAAEERHKAVDEKKKQDTSKKLVAKDKGASATSSRFVSKAGTKSSVTAATKATDATDSPKVLSSSRITSGSTAVTAKRTPLSTSSVSKAISNGTTGGASKATKPAASKAALSGAGASTKPPPSSSAKSPGSKAAGSLASKSTSSVTKLNSKSTHSPAARPQTARSPSVPKASASASTAAAATKTSVSADANSKIASSKPTRPLSTRAGAGATSASISTKPPAKPKAVADSASGSGKTARPSPRPVSSRTVSSVTSSRTVGAASKPSATAVGAKKPLSATKSPAQVSKLSAAGKVSRKPLAGSTKVASKTPTKPGAAKPSGIKPTSSPMKKAPSKPLAKKLEPAKKVDAQTSKTEEVSVDVVIDVSEPEQSETPAVPCQDEAEVKTDVPPVGKDGTPASLGLDASLSADQPAAFTPDTAQRAGQIISSQTSLSKELQSKLPRLGEVVLDGESEAIESVQQPDSTGAYLEPVEPAGEEGQVVKTDMELAEDQTADVEVKTKPEDDDFQRQQEDEREERRKRVDEIMERTRTRGVEGDLQEEEAPQVQEEEEQAQEEVEQEQEEVKKQVQEEAEKIQEEAKQVQEDESSIQPQSSHDAPSVPVVPDSSSVDASVNISTTTEELSSNRGTISAQDSFEFKLAYEPQELQAAAAATMVEVVEEQEREKEEVDPVSPSSNQGDFVQLSMAEDESAAAVEISQEAVVEEASRNDDVDAVAEGFQGDDDTVGDEKEEQEQSVETEVEPLEEDTSVGSPPGTAEDDIAQIHEMKGSEDGNGIERKAEDEAAKVGEVDKMDGEKEEEATEDKDIAVNVEEEVITEEEEEREEAPAATTPVTDEVEEVQKVSGKAEVSVVAEVTDAQVEEEDEECSGVQEITETSVEDSEQVQDDMVAEAVVEDAQKAQCTVVAESQLATEDLADEMTDEVAPESVVEDLLEVEESSATKDQVEGAPESAVDDLFQMEDSPEVEAAVEVDPESAVDDLLQMEDSPAVNAAVEVDPESAVEDLLQMEDSPAVEAEVVSDSAVEDLLPVVGSPMTENEGEGVIDSMNNVVEKETAEPEADKVEDAETGEDIEGGMREISEHGLGDPCLGSDEVEQELVEIERSSLAEEAEADLCSMTLISEQVDTEEGLTVGDGLDSRSSGRSGSGSGAESVGTPVLPALRGSASSSPIGSPQEEDAQAGGDGLLQHEEEALNSQKDAAEATFAITEQVETSEMGLEEPLMAVPTFPEEDLTVGDRLNPSDFMLDDTTPETPEFADFEPSPSGKDSNEQPLLEFTDSNELSTAGIIDTTSALQDLLTNPFSTSPNSSDPFGFKFEEESGTYPQPTSQVPTDPFFNLEESATDGSSPLPVSTTLATDEATAGNLLTFEGDSSI